MTQQAKENRGARSLLAAETASHPARYSNVSPLEIRSAPMLLLALCFSAGMLFRSFWEPSAQMVVACALLLVPALVACRRAPKLAWTATGIFWLALGWTACSLEPTSVDTSLLRYADELQRTVDAQVVAVKRLPPKAVAIEAKQPGREIRGDEENIFAAYDKTHAAYSLDLVVHAIEEITPTSSTMTPIIGGAQVILSAKNGNDVHVPPCGAHVLLTVRLHPPQRYLDPGVWQYADTLAARGISVESNSDAASLHVLETTRIPWRCRFASAQHWSEDRLQQFAGSPAMHHLPAFLQLTPTDLAMLSAMLVGDRTQLDRSLRTVFERTGSFHLFVVAGMHVAILLATVYGLLLRIRVQPWLAAVLSLTVATGYAVLTGFGAPVQRALLMSAVYLFTRLLGRQRNALNALGAAALTISVLHPHALFESGFQMTALAVFAIAGIAVPLSERTLLPYARATRQITSVRNDPYHVPRLAQFRVSLRWLGEQLTPGVTSQESSRKKRKTEKSKLALLPAVIAAFLLWCGELVLVTLVAEMVMALPMAMYFHRITAFAAPVNLLALPLVGLLLGSAIFTFLASLLHPWVALLPASLTALLLHTVTKVVSALGSLRNADVRTPGPLLVFGVAALLLWSMAIYLCRLSPRRSGWIACTLLPLALLLVLWPRHPSLQRNRLEFTAIDVGQGDSLLVASPGGKTMLIDAGGPTGSAALTQQTTFDTGEEVVSPYLWSRGIRQLDVLVLTHAHSDHIGGMAAVLQNFRPRELWLSLDADTPPFRALVQLATDRRITVRHLRDGDRQSWDGTAIRVMGPPVSYLPRKLPTNDDSLVLLISYGKASVLAEGDAEHPSENAMISEGLQHVTLLKVGHHGSNTSTSEDLLRAIEPQDAVISCGRGNRFGHPRMPVLQRLQQAGIHTARTDRMGAVQFLLKADGSIEENVVASNP